MLGLAMAPITTGTAIEPAATLVKFLGTAISLADSGVSVIGTAMPATATPVNTLGTLIGTKLSGAKVIGTAIEPDDTLFNAFGTAMLGILTGVTVPAGGTPFNTISSTRFGILSP